MSINNQHKPGYKHTPLGWIPEEWRVKQVGDVCNFIVPGRNRPTSFDGEIPWITTPDLDSKATVFSSKSNLKISREEAKKVGSKIVPKNSIIMSCVGELGLLCIAGNEIVLNQQLHAFIPKEEVDHLYLFYALGIRKKYMERVATKTAVPYMNKDNCNSIPILLPSLIEQLKIAAVFSTWDKAITKTQQLIAQLQQRNKALMQALLSGKKRLKGFEGEWKKEELENVLDYEQPTNYLTNNFVDEKSDGCIPVLTANKAVVLGYTNETVGIYTNHPVIIFDDFTTASKYIDFDFKVKSSAIKFLSAKRGYNLRYVFERLQLIQTNIAEHKRRWISEFTKKAIFFPSFEEQSEVALVISRAVGEVKLYEQKLAALQHQKKGLMQKLLTGEVRVKIDNNENNENE